MMEPSSRHGHEGGLSVRDQIERYRAAFIAVVVMVLLAAAVGGYTLAHENLKLPGWFPVLGKSFYTLKARFQTAQAVTPGQGQAVTVAGAKIGEVATVNLHGGVATVTMNIDKRYAHFYRDATLLLRPKTQLQDITIEVNPGESSSGRLRSGEVIPISQTAPNIDFDQFLAGFDSETRAYLQELLAGAGEGLNHNGRALAATLKRFAPTTRYGGEIASLLEKRQKNIEHSIHNFRLLIEALGGKDQQLAQLVDASNAVFKTFSNEDEAFQSTLHLLPGALHKTGTNLAKVATASRALGSTLHKLEPFASSLAPAQRATRSLALKTTPIIKNEVRPFARQILPVVNELKPSTQEVSEAFPNLSVSFGVLNEFFNELAYNPGPKQAGFLFFLDWGNHNLNSVVSSGDANGTFGRSVVYFNCEILKLLKAVGEVNPQVNLLVNLLKPPTRQECVNEGLLSASGKAVTGKTTALRKSDPNGAFGVGAFPQLSSTRTRARGSTTSSTGKRAGTVAKTARSGAGS